jgi:hypothetical protein
LLDKNKNTVAHTPSKPVYWRKSEGTDYAVQGWKIKSFSSSMPKRDP